eukprot:scaffold24670_cov117-Cylindrotheca_fusiformis.AAC.2
MPAIMSRHTLSRRPRELYRQGSMKTASSRKKRNVRSPKSRRSPVAYNNSSAQPSENSGSSISSITTESSSLRRVDSVDGWGHFVDEDSFRSAMKNEEKVLFGRWPMMDRAQALLEDS